MPIAVLCPKCSKKLSAPDAMAGKKAKCPHCGQVMQLPVPRPAAPPTQEVFEDLSRSDPLGALGVSSRVSAPIGSTAPARSSAAVGAPSGAPAGGGFGGFDAHQFDEMLADVGPRLDVKPTEPQQERFPCPVCHELIVRGSVKCRFCNTDFNQYLPAKKSGSSTAAHKFRSNMNNLGAVWVALPSLGLGLMFFIGIAASSSDMPGTESIAPTLLLISLPLVFWIVLGIATCRQAIWAVWTGLVLNYIGLVVNVIVITIIFFITYKFQFLFFSVIGLIPSILIIKLAHRCIYWKEQMR